ncbi:DUF805 domain-containing protein [Acinetobacter soli]|uniref:DUF805 domain-containing protein n=1 Tax=Acinetobacter soli TaxID=487316 RepID=UPI00287ECDA4|nr:DUF805 domain-containing protein [Acinetobacter soli]MDS7693278.1 DUF805 domain-containing protein [Acinetobacter soli]
MKGKILDYSIQTSTGIIRAENQQRYSFSGSAWKEQQAPMRGMHVDFEIDAQDQAIDIFIDVPDLEHVLPSSLTAVVSDTVSKETHADNPSTASAPLSHTHSQYSSLTDEQHQNLLANESKYSMMDWVMKCLRNYINFTGRARRKEYWFFQLWYAILSFVMLVLGDAFHWGDNLFLIATLLVGLPAIAVSVRRLHDINRSGWLVLLNLVPVVGVLIVTFFFMIKEGDQTTNSYGPVSK